MYVCMHICLNVCMYICMYVCDRLTHFDCFGEREDVNIFNFLRPLPEEVCKSSYSNTFMYV